MSVIQIVCIIALAAIIIAMNVACLGIGIKADWEEIPAPLIAFTFVADMVILVFVLLGAMGVFG